MRLRPYISGIDFDTIKGWITDRREHALWCADRFAFPIERDNFAAVLNDHAQQHGDCTFVATDDGGKQVGFFCYSLNLGTNEGMLRFVMVDPAERGKGYGKEMLGLAVKYAFDITKADAVQLMVFDANPAARKCYESVGFTERSVTDGAFTFGDEEWGRVNMVMKKNEQSV
ncbi:MAG: GNAT family N-acetyltransferase [Ruminiclostridium sp.]|nr:GNAT family N-acetyltransferase [Ruminiclostridium sp.]